MTEVILGRKIQCGYHSALEDTKAIREIYLEVEQDWSDHSISVEYSWNEAEKKSRTPEKQTLPDWDFGMDVDWNIQDEISLKAPEEFEEETHLQLEQTRKVNRGITTVQDVIMNEQEVQTTGVSTNEQGTQTINENTMILEIAERTKMKISGTNIKIEFLAAPTWQ